MSAFGDSDANNLLTVYRAENIPAYIGNIGSKYYDIVGHIKSVDGYQDIFASMAEMEAFKSPFQQVSKFDVAIPEKIIDLLYKFQTDTWTEFYNLFPTIKDNVGVVVNDLAATYDLLGINLADKPDLLSIGVLIPLLNVVVQFIATKTP